MASQRFNKRTMWISIGITIVILLVLLLSFLGIKNSSDVKRSYGLYDVIQVGGLSFQLTGVTLQEEGQWVHNSCEKAVYVNGGTSGPYTCIPSEKDEQVFEGYNLFWTLSVVNNGEKIENVSECGILLFEDGSQYKFELRGSYDASKLCEYSIMVPGEKKEIYDVFSFSNDVYDYSTGRFIVSKNWSDVPGSNITFFSQQNDGLVKFTVNKNQINYLNNYRNVTISKADENFR